jgi:signal transduction histidine kinase
MNDFARQLEGLIPRLRRHARGLTRDVSRADDVVQSCLARALAKQHLWQRRPGSDLRAWLFTILHNQYVNEVRHSVREEPGGSVVVAVRRHSDGGIVFEVRDTGPGMTPEEIVTALEPFGQVDAGHTRQYEGPGLGLPLARRLAELHGGSLHLSGKKGLGTIATLTLPASRVMVDIAARRLDVTAGVA